MPKRSKRQNIALTVTRWFAGRGHKSRQEHEPLDTAIEARCVEFYDLLPQPEVGREDYRNEIVGLFASHVTELSEQLSKSQDGAREVAGKLSERESAHKYEIEQSQQQQQIDLADAGRRHYQELQTLSSSHYTELQREKDRHDQLVQKLEDGHSTDLTRANDRLERLQSDHFDDVEKLRKEHDNAERELRQEISNLNNDIWQWKTQHYDQIQGLRKEHEDAQEELRKEHDEAQTRLRWDVQQDRMQLESQLQQALEKQAEIMAANQVASEMQARDFRHHEEALVAEHKQETHHMRRQVSELNTALVARDDEQYNGAIFTTSGLPQKSDGKLKESFSQIEKVVDDLGRIAWKVDQTTWSEDVLQRLSGQHGIRMLKKAIVQDFVWCALFTYIFASPYRMFGAEGDKLEKEWVQQCGQDVLAGHDEYTWPAASAHAERWRYMTLSGCREILTKPVPSQYDPRVQLKKGFDSAVRELTRCLKDTLGSLATLDPSTLQAIDWLSKQAARTWLEFGMHRCRVVVRLTGNGTTELSQRAAAVQGGSVALTVSPAIDRYGNHKGDELHVPIVLSTGDSLAIP